jgi:hypothetical protein
VDTHTIDETDDPYTRAFPISVNCLQVGDVFPSHDGLRHEVEQVSPRGPGRVVVAVRKSSGERYDAELQVDSMVNVL